MANRSLFFAYLLSTLLCMTFFMPMLVLPYLTKANGISATTYGYLQTVLMGLQIIGGPIFGSMIRLYGMKTSLNICYASNLLWALTLWISQDFYGMLISSIAGIFMNAQQAHQALITVLTENGEERTNAFGKIGFTFGFNFLLSPLCVKIVTTFFGERAVIFCSVLLALSAIIINHLFIDEKDFKSTEKPDTKKSNTSSWDATIKVLNRPNVLNAFSKKILNLTPLILIFMNLQLYMIRKFNISVGEYGAFQAFTGVFMMAINGFGIGWLRARMSEPKLMILGNACVVLTMLQYAYFEHLWQLVLIIPPMALGMSLVGAVADSIITSSVKAEEQGIILGIVSGVDVFFRTISPALGGYILDHYGFGLLGLIGLLSSGTALGGAFIAPIGEVEKPSQNGKLVDNKTD